MTCDECLTAAYDEGAAPDIQEEVCRTLGADLPDHICEDVENDTGFCNCACKEV